MILYNLPALQVVIPLIAALICPMLSGKRMAWGFATIISAIAFATAIYLAGHVYASGTILYVMGGWVAPYGIEYRIDSLATLFLMLVSGSGFFSCIYALPSVEKEIDEARHKYFYSTYLLLLAGLLGIVTTNDIFNIYVFLEISSLATYALIAMGKDRRSLIASFEYLILGTIGATFILIGIGLIYSMTGSLNIMDIIARIQPVSSSLPVKMAFAFFTLGFALKIAIFPLHLWLVNAYTNSPSFISSFLCATAAKVGIYLLVRISFFVFGLEFSFSMLPFGQILIFLGVAGLLVGSVVAIMQDNVKRMLAYSSVAQIGYILIGIGLANQQGASAAMLQVIFHAIAKSSMFMAAGAVLYSVKGVRIEHFEGIGKNMPITMAVFIIGGLSLIGMPGTAGFISKWYLLQGTIAAQMWPVFAVVILSSLLTLVYIWRVIEIAYFGHVDSTKGYIKEAPIFMLVPMVLLAALSIIWGIFPNYVLAHVAKIAEILFG